MEKEKMIRNLAVIVLLMLLVLSIIYLFSIVENTNSNQDTTPFLATSYENISAEKAYSLFEKSNNSENDYELIIIDARVKYKSCISCLNNLYSSGHIPGAILDTQLNAQVYYQDLNDTSDILVYTQQDSSQTESFCEELVDHIYGKIYNLEGGYLSWIDAGYPIET